MNLRRTAVMLTVVVALATVGTAVAAPAAGSFDAATVTAGWGGTASVADTTGPAAVAGEAAAGDGEAFTFTVDCGGSPCTGVAIAEIAAHFGDGTRTVVDVDAGTTTTTGPSGVETTSGASTTLTHRYTDPGRYRVAVQVLGRPDTGTRLDRHATRYVEVAAATPTADLVDMVDLAARDAMLQMVAADAYEACGPAVNGVHDVAGTRTGRDLSCPDPAAVYTSPPDATAVGSAVNGVTGADCTARHWACGLDPAEFAQAGSPLNGCNDTRCPDLTGVDEAASPTTLTYTAGRCGDGWTAVRASAAWDIRAGLPEGCLTRGQLYTALLALVDGPGGTATADPAITCTDAGSYTAAQLYPILRAETLGIPALTADDPDQTADLCAPDRPAHRDEAYAALGLLLGRTGDPATTGLVDLPDLHLGHTPETVSGHRTLPAPLPQPNGDLIAGALDAGVPLPATTACPDGQTPCLNPDTPLTRAELARMIDPVLQ